MWYFFVERPWFTWGIVLVGIFLRIYALDRDSLWLDEAWVANLISSKDLISLFYTDYPVPPFFVSSIYFMIHMFKNNEWFLRIIPALFGVGGVILIYYTMRIVFGKTEAIGSLILFSFLPVFVIYSRELKQYSADIFFVLLLLLIIEYIQLHKDKLFLWVLLALSGAVGLWFSSPLVFVLCAGGLLLLWNIIKSDFMSREQYKLLSCWMGVFSFILLSLFLLYWLIIKHQSTEVGLINYWKGVGGFPPYADAGSILKWILFSAGGLFLYFWNFYAPIVIFFTLVGIWYLYRNGKSRIIYYWAIVFLLLFIASFFHLYPFGSYRVIGSYRVLLFTAPIFLILFISGIRGIWELSRKRNLWKPLAYIGIFLFFVQVADAAVYYKYNKGFIMHNLFHRIQDIKSALYILEKKQKENETIYVYYGAKHAFDYYTKYYYMKNSFSPILIGNKYSDNSGYIKEMRPLLEQKMPFWFLATQVNQNETYMSQRDTKGDENNPPSPPFSKGGMGGFSGEQKYIHHALQYEWNYRGQVFPQNDDTVLIYYYPENQVSSYQAG